MLIYPSFRHKLIDFRSTLPSHQIVVTSSYRSQTAQKVSSKRVLTPYQKSFFFDKMILDFFGCAISDFSPKSMKNKGKTLVFDHFPLFFIDFDGNPSKI